MRDKIKSSKRIIDRLLELGELSKDDHQTLSEVIECAEESQQFKGGTLTPIKNLENLRNP